MDSSNIDLLADLGEVALDQLLENQVLKEIPILGSAVNIARAGIGIRERAFLNKIQIFVSMLPEQSEEDKQRMILELNKDSKSRVRFGEAVFSTIEQSASSAKVEYVAIVFSAFIKGEISSRELRELCHSINVTQTDDLLEFAEEKHLNERMMRELVHTGLTDVRYPTEVPTTPGSINVKPEFGITKNGNILRNLVMEQKKS